MGSAKNGGGGGDHQGGGAVWDLQQGGMVIKAAGQGWVTGRG
jgi:hypothetical protein